MADFWPASKPLSYQQYREPRNTLEIKAIRQRGEAGSPATPAGQMGQDTQTRDRLL